MTKEEMRAHKAKRVETAISLREPDRVPFAPMINAFYMMGYGISTYDVMMDFRNMIPGVQGYMRDYDPDGVFLAGLYGIKVLEALGTDFINWPGVTCGLPLDAPFQHTDGTYLQDDELREFILDPTHCTLTKILPRKHKKLKGLSKLYLRETFDTCYVNDLTLLADPEIQEAVNTLMQAGKYQKERAGQLGAVIGAIAEEGYPLLAQGTMCVPFDAYADSVRGIIRATLDTIEFPDELEEILNTITEMNVDRILTMYQTRGVKRVFIPLHCGVDEFMSPASYEKFYWPGLKKSIDGIVERGMEPWIFCEGNYTTRLEVISDVPKAKVTYCFEKVDIKRAKETVGKVACICGTVPTALLGFGTPEQVERATKEQIDILAPGGGFIMNSSIIIDNAKHENMRIWRDTTEKYGQY
jgi:uroporphyrinogen-III decarboxylase